MKISKTFIWLAIYQIFLLGCSTLQSWNESMPWTDKPERNMRYSDNPQVGAPSQRQYKKTTRARLEEESDLGSQAGSMWVMDGQTSYLFSQNKNRKEGDILNVKLDGPALKQVETKVAVIKKLIKELEEQAKLEAAKKRGGPAEEVAVREPAAAPATAEEKVDLSDIQLIPTRVVERTADGNLRLRGSMPFMIDKKEYKVLVTGNIRPEDFNDEGVSSTKLMDSQFDVVSLRRRGGGSEMSKAQAPTSASSMQ